MQEKSVFHGGRRTDEWVWCTVCLRCYPVTASRWDGAQVQQSCFYRDCTGNRLQDTWTWADMRRLYAHFPVVPELNVVYFPTSEETSGSG